jgi:hypothetical protein
MNAVCKLLEASLEVEFFTGGSDVNMQFSDGNLRKVEACFSHENLRSNFALVNF